VKESPAAPRPVLLVVDDEPGTVTMIAPATTIAG